MIRRVERARRRGRVSTPALYLRSMLSEYFLGTDRRHPAISLERPGEPAIESLANAIIQNTAPWTYLGDRADQPQPGRVVRPRPRRAGAASAARAEHVTDGDPDPRPARPDPHGRQVLRLHDVAEFTLVAAAPEAFQLDGDYLGEREKVRFTSVPQALRVIC